MQKGFITILGLAIILTIYLFLNRSSTLSSVPVPQENNKNQKSVSAQEENTQKIIIPKTKTLENDYHVYQSFNNCGPASLSMTLSYYGINISQVELGEHLRPYQNLQGDNDDKSVTLEELGDYAAKYDLTPYHRPNGSIDLLKQFVANDIPVLTRTWLESDDDIGHFRVVIGYDEITEELIQDDSYQGNDLRYSYDEFNDLWSKFNYEYLVLIPNEKMNLAQQIIGADVDEHTSWENAKRNAEKQLKDNENDITARFNLSIAHYHLGEFEEAIREYESIADQLPFRTLWYQIEPIKAYYEVGNYEKVFEITDQVLNNHNRAYSEVYIIRGDSFKAQDQSDLAKQEYEKAVYYNINLPNAREKLNSL